MSAADRVDAALAGLDQGELVTIPGLQDVGDRTRWEDDRRAISAKLGTAKPSARYGLATASAA